MFKIPGNKNPLPAFKKAFVIWILVFGSSFCPRLQAAVGEKAMVVTSDPRATEAALEVLKQGGNAVDAAVTAAWVLNVVEPQASGLGGSGLALFYDIGTKRILFFDGSVRAPAKISREMFLDPSGMLPPYQPERNSGGLPVAVPGLLKLAEEIHSKYGTQKFPFAKLFDPAIRAAEEGVEVSGPLAKTLRENAKRLDLSDPERNVFFEKGVSLEEGQKLSQPELAKTFRLIGAKGADAFYKGAIAQAITGAVQKNGYQPGFLTLRDLKDYEIAKREPLHSTYQGYDLFSAGPPADGGVMLFRALNILSHFGVPGLGQVPETYHLLAEAQKVALFNRSGVADPDLYDVPVKELLSEAWGQDRAGAIKFDRVLKNEEPSGRVSERGKKRTGSSVMVVDPQGNMLILSATLGDAFGSGLRVPGYGFFLNDLMMDLIQTSQDLQGADPLSGGQRPQGPEAPVFLFKEGKAAMIMNAYGPDDSAAMLFNVIAQTVDLGVPCSDAVTFPRLLVRGEGLYLEPKLYDQEMIRLKLDLLGHKTAKEDHLGFTQIVCFDAGSGKIHGEGDPRSNGTAEGF